MYDLSILIPARNEIFLKRTIEDILSNIEGDTEIIAVLDGYWPDIEIDEHERLTILHYEESIGQRAATNCAAKISTAKYLMKCDAHCAFDKGFDIKLMEDMDDNWTVAPIMRNLHAFDWVCKKCGNRRYQGPTPTNCPDCDNTTDFEMDVVWIAKPNPQSTSYCFDTTLHFQYFGEFKKRPEGQKELSETLSLQGSCFMLTRDKYFELNICDEEWGSWGQQGVEVALKTWLSGGKVICNHKTWYAHLFRTQGGDFSFPYPQSGKAIEKVRKISRDVFFNNKYEKQVKPLSWLIEKFKPVPYWHEPNGEEILKEINEKGNKFYSKEKTLTKGIVYYTDNLLDPKILTACQKKLLKSANGIPIINVSLKPLDFGTKNIVLPLERGYLTMFKQILRGLEELNTDIIFFCEHDVLYHPSHFDFVPPRNDIYYYNTNVWKVRMSDGHGLHYDCQQLSGMCAYKSLLLSYYQKLVEIVETNGFTRKIGFEPGTHNRPERIDDYKAESWKSELPNIDLRHDTNLTESRWEKEEFRNSKFTEGWIENDNIPGWGHLWHFWKRI